MTYYGREVHERMRHWWDNELTSFEHRQWLIRAESHPDDLERLKQTMDLFDVKWVQLRAQTRDAVTKALAQRILEEE